MEDLQNSVVILRKSMTTITTGVLYSLSGQAWFRILDEAASFKKERANSVRWFILVILSLGVGGCGRWITTSSRPAWAT